jgi:hypothetical protein
MAMYGSEPDPMSDVDPYDAEEQRRRLAAAEGGGVDLAPAPTPTFTTPGEHVGTASPSPAPAPLFDGSRFSADQWDAFRTATREAGGSDAYFDDFIRRNPDDPNRAAESLIPTSHRPYDSQTNNQNEQYQNSIADAQRGTATAPMRAPTRAPGVQYGGASGQQPGQVPLAPFQFDDPYTNQYEAIAQAQLNQVRDNPALNQLLQFLQSQFETRSQSPGMTPDELAVMRTQAFEPIEDYRNASKQRSAERTAARGMLPSSGLAELDLRDIDMAADQNRTRLDRDLAMSQIDRRRQDQTQAAQIAQMLGITIPGMQRTEELMLGNSLYQLPRTAMQDALSVVNGTSNPNDMFTQSLQLQQQQLAQQQQAMRLQQENDARNAAIWQQLGGLFAGMFS